MGYWLHLLLKTSVFWNEFGYSLLWSVKWSSEVLYMVYPKSLKISEICRYRDRRWDLKQLVGSGGMPSSHSATVTALAAAIGLQEGFGGSMFAISLVIACVVWSLSSTWNAFLKEIAHSLMHLFSLQVCIYMITLLLCSNIEESEQDEKLTISEKMSFKFVILSIQFVVWMHWKIKFLFIWCRVKSFAYFLLSYKLLCLSPEPQLASCFTFPSSLQCCLLNKSYHCFLLVVINLSLDD